MLLRNGKKILRLLIAVVAAVIVVLFVVSFNGMCRHGSCNNVIALNDGWSISFGGIHLPPMEHVSDFRVPSNIQPGDTIIYERDMRNDSIPLPTTLRFHAYHVAVAVYVDSVCYYRYGFERFKEGKLVGSGIHLVNMPEFLDDHVIRVVTIVTEKAAAKSVAQIELLRSNSMTDYFSQNSDSITIGIFLMFFGMIAFITGCCAVSFDRAYYRLVLIGLFAGLMGLWTLNYAKGIQIVSTNYALDTTLEYVSPVWPFDYQYACGQDFDLEVERAESHCRLWCAVLCGDDDFACDRYCALPDVLAHLP